MCAGAFLAASKSREATSFQQWAWTAAWMALLVEGRRGERLWHIPGGQGAPGLCWGGGHIWGSRLEDRQCTDSACPAYETLINGTESVPRDRAL